MAAPQTRRPRPRAAGPRRAALVAPPPALVRDPWAWAAALAVLPTLIAARSSPLGEPFADDFRYLDFSLLRHNPSWWDGGGCVAYWRPLARQAYYGLLGPVMLAHPWAIGVLHALALAAAGVLIYRALRRSWSGPAAAAAGAFPAWLDGARVLLAWPSAMQDLGALLLLALVLHAAVRGRAVLAAVAALGAVLCKEIAAPLALLAAFAPRGAEAGGARRTKIVVGATLAAWAIVRFGVLRAVAGLIVSSAAPAAAPLPARLAQSLARLAGDALGTPALAAHGAGLVAVAVAMALLPLALALLARTRRVPTAWRWSAWGLAWFVAAGAPLALLLPEWATFRAVIPAVGLGIAVLAPLSAARWRWFVPLVAARLAALSLAPQPTERLEVSAADEGNALAFPRLAQLQRAVHQARATLAREAPRLRPHAVVVKEGWPRMVGVAFQGDLALHAWHRDTTVRWLTSDELRRAEARRLDAVIEFEPLRSPQFVTIAPAAMLASMEGLRAIRAHHEDDALRSLAAAESLSRDTSAAQFLSTVAALRAVALLGLGRATEAIESAGLALGHYPASGEARWVMAEAMATQGDWRGARDVLALHMRYYPDDDKARALLAEARRRVDATSH